MMVKPIGISKLPRPHVQVNQPFVLGGVVSFQTFHRVLDFLEEKISTGPKWW